MQFIFNHVFWIKFDCVTSSSSSLSDEAFSLLYWVSTKFSLRLNKPDKNGLRPYENPNQGPRNAKEPV